MVMLHVNLVYCVPNIIKIGRHLKKQQSYEKGGRFETPCRFIHAVCLAAAAITLACPRRADFF